MADAVVFLNPVPNKAPQISTFKFVDIISPFYDKVTILSSCLDAHRCARVVNLKYKKQQNKVLRVLNFAWFQLKAFLKSVAVLKKGDVAFFWVGDKMFSSMLACKLKGVETYFFLYGNTSLESASKKAKTTAKCQQYLSNKADFVCAESKSVLTDRGIKLSDRTKFIHLYVDTDNTLSDKLNRVGMLCRLASGKCVLESIEGFAEFHKTHPEYVLDIVGDGVLYEQCIDKIAQLGADDYITMCGWLDHDEVNKKIAQWKLLLFATKTEGMPNSVLECMAKGVPALCSKVGGLKDIIVDKENGYFLSGDDFDSIADGLSAVFDFDTLDTVSDNAKATVDNKFTLKKARENFKSQMGY